MFVEFNYSIIIPSKPVSSCGLFTEWLLLYARYPNLLIHDQLPNDVFNKICEASHDIIVSDLVLYLRSKYFHSSIVSVHSSIKVKARVGVILLMEI